MLVLPVLMSEAGVTKKKMFLREWHFLHLPGQHWSFSSEFTVIDGVPIGRGPARLPQQKIFNKAEAWDEQKIYTKK